MLFLGSIFILASPGRAQNDLSSGVDSIFITNLDINKLANEHLKGFTCIRSRAKWRFGREFLFKQVQENIKVFVRVGLHPSHEIAEEIALDYLQYVSAVMVEENFSLEPVGDRVWWWSPNLNPDKIKNIVFIRHNCLVMLSSQRFDNLKNLATVIDNDLLNGEKYNHKNIAISLPSINSIVSEKSIVRVGETTKLLVYANDPSNEILEYVFSPGVIKTNEPIGNSFIIKPSKDHFQGQLLGNHVHKCIVINESNVVSNPFEIWINFAQ